MVKSFLQQIIEHSGILQDKGAGDMLFVFPNRRACLHFKGELATQLSEPSWSPAVISLADLVQNQYPGQIADTLTLIFELFQVYRNTVEGADNETLDSFFPWGSMMLRDFDEADRYLLNAEQLFREIRDLRNLEARFQPELRDYESFKNFWRTFSNEPISGMQQKFALIWNRMGGLYKSFQSHLKQANLAYEGMAYRYLAEQTKWMAELPYRSIYLCGFNALSASEISIFKQLIEKREAKLCWDVDPFYLDDPNHEAGHFIRTAMAKLPAPEPQWLEPKLAAIPKQIQTMGVAGQSSQPQVASLSLKRLMAGPGFDPQKTAIVLPDESLLPALLYALPKEVKDLNITMGYTLQQSSTFSLLDALMKLHKTDQSEKKGFSHRHVISLLGHPFIEQKLGSKAQELIQYLQDNQLLFPKPTQLIDSGNHFLQLLFQPVTTVDGLLQRCRELILQISQTLDGEENPFVMEREFLLQFYKIFQRLEELSVKYKFDLSFDSLDRLTRQLSMSQSLPFSGEPLRGLQVMGLLETRALDFENVIILSANEGKLPATKLHHSYIPYPIRKAFGLPTYDQQDGLFAYHTYRLIQRARDVTFIYSSNMDRMNEGEPSRFIKQIEYELVGRYPNIDFKEGTVHLKPLFTDAQSITIQKNGEILERLQAFTDQGGKYLSPSSIATYVNCPLQFYFNHVLGLRETEDLDEDLDAIRLGNIFHSAMEDLYETKLGKALQPEDYAHFEERLDEVLLKAYREYYSAAMDKPEGKNVLNYQFLKKSAQKIFDLEKDLGIVVTALETKEYGILLPISVNGSPHKIRINGYFDRLDEVNGTARIVDYKTGGQINIKSSHLENPGPLFDDPKYKANLQGLIYALLYLEHHPSAHVGAGFYHLRELSQGLKVVADGPLTTQDLSAFKSRLLETISEIFDPAVPFSQTTDVKRCTYCPFKGICER